MRAFPAIVAPLFVVFVLGTPAKVDADPQTSVPNMEAATAGTATDTRPGPDPRTLTIASWGGAYSKSQEIAFIRPFQKETGIAIKLISHKGAFDKLKRGGDAGQPEWDVVDLGSGTLDAACRAGLLERIRLDDIAAAGGELPARSDFLPGALHECGIASVAWSAAVVFNRNAYKKAAPKTAEDFFNLEKFPGKRGLPRGPKYTLELALIADGVSPDSVYALLETESGVARAFDILDRIRREVVWWTRGHEPLKRLADGTVSQTIAFSGRVFNSIVRQNRPFGIIWDGQIYDLDMWAVPKGSPNKEAAIRFIAFSIRADRLVEQTRWFPYGPMRKSAIAKIGRHAEADVDMRDFVPTAKTNFRRALRLNTPWWADNEEQLTKRFQAWLIAPASAGNGMDTEAENAIANVSKIRKPAAGPKKRNRKRNRGRRN